MFAEKYPDPSDLYDELMIKPFSHPALTIEDPVYKEEINVLIVLDLSGSMNNKIDDQPMIDIARESIEEFISNLPNNANVGLRVYGHIGSGKKKDKERSCSRSDLVYDMQPYEQNEFMDALYKYEPTGYTPIAYTLEQSAEDFADYPAEQYTNLIYLVSDGIETCGGNPVKVAKSLSESEIYPIINVIGFGVDEKAQRQLEEIAEISRGIYSKAGNEKELNKVFHQQEEMLTMWEEWQQNSLRKIENHKREQITDIEQFYEEWKTVNDWERANLFFIINELRNIGYITESAHSYFATMRNSRTEDYTILVDDLYADLYEKIMENYKENKTQINKDLE